MKASSAIAIVAAIFSINSIAASYKCKDANGNWSEQACTGVTKPAEPIRPAEKTPPRIGMTAAQVMGGTWGVPDKVNTTETANGQRAQWVYNDVNGIGIRFLYFDNGILTAIQD